MKRWHTLLAISGLLMGAQACSDDTTTGQTPDGGGDVADMGGDMVVEPDGLDEPDTVEEPDVGDDVSPEIMDLTLVENLNNNLSGVLDLDLDEDGTVTVDVSNGGGHDFTIGPTDMGTEHEVWVLGLHPDTEYTLTITAVDASGNETVDIETFETAPLPDDLELPPMTVLASEPESMAEGFTLFGVGRWPANTAGNDPDWGRILMLDASGEVIWYYRVEEPVDDIRQISNGNLLFIIGHERAREIDLLGNTVREWQATNLPRPENPVEGVTPGVAKAPAENEVEPLEVAIDTFHHEIIELPNGNFLTLSTEAIPMAQEDCEGWEQAYTVVGDAYHEFVPETGEVVQSWSVFDMIDPCRRITHGFAGGFWEATYGAEDVPPTADWTHGNAVIFDEAGNAVVASLRHSDWVIAFRYADDDGDGPDESGDVLWRFGEEGDFELTAGEFQRHQHAPMLTSTGHLLLFDNGNLRPGTDFEGTDNLPYSRAVEYELDTSGEVPYEATQVWQYRNDVTEVGDVTLHNYAPFVGDADELPNGNVLITFGGLVDPPADAIVRPDVKKFARIVEVTHDDEPEVVFEVLFLDPAETDFVGYTIYRAERLPSLY